MLVLLLDDSGLALNDEQNLVVFENHGLGQVGLVFEPVPHLRHLGESCSSNRLRLANGLALLVLDSNRGHMDVVDIWPKGHNLVD